MNVPFVFQSFGGRPWFRALQRLRDALATGDARAAGDAYRTLFRALVEERSADPAVAAAAALLWEPSPLSASLGSAASPDALESAPDTVAGASRAAVPAGVLEGARHDLRALRELVRAEWRARTTKLLDEDLPPLERLAAEPAGVVREFADALVHEDPDVVLERLVERYRRHGSGPAARYDALRWTGAALEPVRHPSYARLERLVDLERPLGRLVANTEAFLRRLPAQHALLYGPRGSGKSTAVRGLLRRYASEGLRLVEVPSERLGDLLEVVEPLRGDPHRFVVFVDDLTFDAHDARYAPLRTLLEGSLTARPANVVVYATSNRRHLVRERHSDRPDPLDDDVHAWDTQNERLALADRFGLTVTFPDASQARYLRIVRGLAEREGLELEDLEERAVRFAEWGNGASGRTAQQFVDSLVAESRGRGERTDPA